MQSSRSFEVMNNKYQFKVSIIVSVYNHEKYISRCIRSLLSQAIDPSSYEIILVDDSSADNSCLAVQQFLSPKPPLITLLRNEINKGLPYSLNKGIKAAQGQYIVRVDSDDYVNSMFVGSLCYYLDSHPTHAAVSCDYYHVNEDEEILDYYDSSLHPIACGVMFRSESLHDIGLYNVEFRCREEEELMLRFKQSYTLGHLPLPLYRYRRHNNNLTENTELMDLYGRKLLGAKINP